MFRAPRNSWTVRTMVSRKAARRSGGRVWPGGPAVLGDPDRHRRGDPAGREADRPEVRQYTLDGRSQLREGDRPEHVRKEVEADVIHGPGELRAPDPRDLAPEDLIGVEGRAGALNPTCTGRPRRLTSSLAASTPLHESPATRQVSCRRLPSRHAGYWVLPRPGATPAGRRSLARLAGRTRSNRRCRHLRGDSRGRSPGILWPWR